MNGYLLQLKILLQSTFHNQQNFVLSHPLQMATTINLTIKNTATIKLNTWLAEMLLQTADYVVVTGVLELRSTWLTWTNDYYLKNGPH